MRHHKSILGITVLVLAAAGVVLYFRGSSSCLPTRQKVMTNAGTATNRKGDNSRTQGQADEAPFACDMQTISADERPRHLTVIEQMRQATREVKELPDGYAFRFDASQPTILLASEFISRERACCPFFTFELVAERNEGPLWLNLRGREGIKDFIRAELNIEP